MGLLGLVIPKCLLGSDPGSEVAATETGCYAGRKQQPAKTQAMPIKSLRARVMPVLSHHQPEHVMGQAQSQEEGVGVEEGGRVWCGACDAHRSRASHVNMGRNV